MSAITIKDGHGDNMKVSTQDGVWWIDTDRSWKYFTDPAELKRLADFILANLEEKK